MAPRKTKRTATENLVVTADSNVSPPKKKKTTANSVKEKLKQQKTDKQEENVVINESASPPKKSRPRAKNAATKADKTKSKSKKIKQEGIATAMVKNNNADEAIAGQVVETKARGKSVARKAGTKKPAVTKLEIQVPDAKGQRNEVAIEDGGDIEEKKTGRSAATKRNRRANGPTEENQEPVAEQLATKTSRKRKIAETIIKTDAKVTKEEPIRRSRVKANKMEMDTDNASNMKSRGRPKKISTKASVKLSSKKSETKKHNVENIAIEKDNIKAKVVKNLKKGNAKKSASKVKHNSTAEKIDSTIEEKEIVMPETNVKENDNIDIVQTLKNKQKKKDTGKRNVAKKTEIKGKQKKGQTFIIDKKETGDKIENENETEEMDSSKISNETDTKNVLSIISNSSLQEADRKDKINENKEESMKDIKAIKSASLMETD